MGVAVYVRVAQEEPRDTSVRPVSSEIYEAA